MQSIAAALGDDIHIPAERAAQFRLAARGHDLKLIDHVQTDERPGHSRRIVIRADAINNEAVRKISLAPDRNSLTRHRRGFREKLVGRRVGRRNARDK